MTRNKKNAGWNGARISLPLPLSKSKKVPYGGIILWRTCEAASRGRVARPLSNCDLETVHVKRDRMYSPTNRGEKKAEKKRKHAGNDNVFHLLTERRTSRPINQSINHAPFVTLQQHPPCHRSAFQILPDKHHQNTSCASHLRAHQDAARTSRWFCQRRRGPPDQTAPCLTREERNNLRVAKKQNRKHSSTLLPTRCQRGSF